MTFGSLVSLAIAAVRSPRETATTLLAMGVPSSALLPSFVLVVVLNVLLTVTAQSLGAQPAEGGELPPLAVAAILCALLGAYILGLYRTGRAWGGTGSLEETALLVVFLQFVVLLAQVVEALLWVAAPPLASMFFIAVAIVAFWVHLNFVDVLHGYGSLWKSFGLMVMVSLGIVLVFILLLTLTGVSLQGTS